MFVHVHIHFANTPKACHPSPPPSPKTALSAHGRPTSDRWYLALCVLLTLIFLEDSLDESGVVLCCEMDSAYSFSTHLFIREWFSRRPFFGFGDALFDYLFVIACPFCGFLFGPMTCLCIVEMFIVLGLLQNHNRAFLFMSRVEKRRKYYEDNLNAASFFVDGKGRVYEEIHQILLRVLTFCYNIYYIFYTIHAMIKYA